MPDWDIVMAVTVLGIGNIGPQQKLIKRRVVAPSLAEAISLAPMGLLTVQILSGKAVDATDPTIPTDPVVP